MEQHARRVTWPRSLYTRGALIVLLPILTIQLVLSVVFIQRLYADVTEQMTRNLLVDVRAVLDEVDRAPTAPAASDAAGALAAALALELELPAERPAGDTRVFYDVSGLTIRDTLRERLSGVRAVGLDLEGGRVDLRVATRHGDARIGVPRRRVSARNPHQLPVLMLFVSLLMAVIAWLFLRNQLRPVRKLASAAEAFGKGRSVQYGPRGATEVRRAGQAFLDMRNRIERQIEQRTMMLSAVSHDLRTPLTRMRLSLEMLEPGPEIEELRRDIGEMEALVGEFLDFARGAALDDVQQVDPATIATSVAEKARRAGSAIELDGCDGGVEVALRPAAVERALDNLVANAVRYGRKARLSLAVTDRAVRFSLEDDGPGIPAAARETALKPFSRLDAARNQDRGSGVGLGLSIAADIARQHGGQLRLTDSARLGGLRADFVLPR